MTSNQVRWLTFGLLCAGLFLSGCATPEARLTTTASGNPEVFIKTTNVGAIKSAIIGDLVNFGYSIESDTEYSLSLSRALTPGEDFGASLATGNAYSTNRRVSTYTFVKQEEGIRVIANTGWRAQMPGGQVRTTPLEANNTIYNTFQTQLSKIKVELEKTSAPETIIAAKDKP